MTAAIDPKVLDHALIESALFLVGQHGWHRLSLVEAARDAGLPVDQVRARYPFKACVLTALSRLADEAALQGDHEGLPLRDVLFDLLMRRFDVFQEHRTGLRTVLHTLPRDPALAALIATATLDSLRWVADYAGLDRRGLSGAIRLNSLGVIWTHAVRAWEKDDTPDLSSTMNALDHALNRAERFGMLKSLYTQETEGDTEEDSGLPDYVPAEDE